MTGDGDRGSRGGQHVVSNRATGRRVDVVELDGGTGRFRAQIPDQRGGRPLEVRSGPARHDRQGPLRPAPGHHPLSEYAGRRAHQGAGDGGRPVQPALERPAVRSHQLHRPGPGGFVVDVDPGIGVRKADDGQPRGPDGHEEVDQPHCGRPRNGPGGSSIDPRLPV